KDFQWGSSPFNFLISIHASTAAGAKHHLVRRIAIDRAGFPSPVNFASPSPVYVGLCDRPTEVASVWHNGSPTQWLMSGGEIVNLARSDMSITIDTLYFELYSESQMLQQLIPPNWFYTPDRKLITPNADGRVPLTAPQAYFVFGFPVQLSGSKPTVRVGIQYT